MGHVTNTLGAILLILGMLGMAAGAGTFTYGTMDEEAANQEFPQDSERIDQDQMMAVGGISALGMGFGLFIIGIVLASRPGLHKEEVSTGIVATRKTFGVLLLLVAVFMLLIGIGLISFGYMAEGEQGSSFQYDQDEGQMNIAAATAGAVMIAFGLPLLVSSIVMVSKGDQVKSAKADRPSTMEDLPASEEVPNETQEEPIGAAREEILVASEPPADANRTPLFVLAGIFGFIMLLAVIFLSLNGGQGDGGLFGDSKVSEETVYNGTISNSGNNFLTGTIGETWSEEFDALNRVAIITFQFETSSTTAFAYSIDQLVNGTWVSITSETANTQTHEIVVSGDFAMQTIRFTVEPSNAFVQEASLGVLVIQES